MDWLNRDMAIHVLFLKDTCTVQACLWLFFNYLNAYLCGVEFYKIPFPFHFSIFFSLTMRKEYICNKKELSIKEMVIQNFEV